MRQLGRIAIVLCLVVSFGSVAAGVANGFEYDGIVRCCCGAHDADHPCDCPTCPGVGRLRFAHRKHHEPAPRHTSWRNCGGRDHTSALTVLPPLVPPATGNALARVATPLPRIADFPALADRAPAATRPPP